MYECVEKVVIQGVIPCMPRGSDYGKNFFLLYSSDSYSYLYQKDYINTYIYIYIRKL